MCDKLSLELTVPFGTEREAEIAYNSLRVDAEPSKGGAITREMHTDGTRLCVKWCAAEARKLRVSVNGFMEHLALVIQTIAEFQDG